MHDVASFSELRLNKIKQIHPVIQVLRPVQISVPPEPVSLSHN